MKKLLSMLALVAGSVLAADVPPSTIVVTPGAQTTVTVTRRAGNTSKAITMTVNKSDVVTITPPPMNHGGAVVDLPLPLGRAGVKQDLLETASVSPTPDEIGSFRTVCYLTKVSFDDPIVYPGMPGMSHMHYFFGNDTTDAASTLATLRKGGSSCRGGTVNQTAYWEPGIVNGTKPVIPDRTIVYYKNGYLLKPPFTAMPEGFKMIAGNSKATGPEGFPASFVCFGDSGEGPHTTEMPQACPVGNTIWATVEFPQCWNGKDLDSADHKSHMSFPVQNQQPPFEWHCPATHPVQFPLVVINVAYIVKPGDDTSKWRLASDMYDPKLPGGYTLHADWFNGWKPDIMAIWVANCNNALQNCGAELLGDGRKMTIFEGN